MKVLYVQSQFNENDEIPREWLVEYDLVLIKSFSQKLNLALESQQKRLPTLFKVKPELSHYPLKSHLAIFGEKLSKDMVHKLNSDYTIEFVSGKLDSVQYAFYIKQNILPIGFTGYIYFHDFYFHALGVHNIPKSFTQWWSNSKNTLPEVDLVLMASVVEWTTLKEISPMILEMFTPDKWNQLDLFFMDQDRNKFNAKEIGRIYKKHKDPLNQFLKDWAKTSLKM